MLSLAWIFFTATAIPISSQPEMQTQSCRWQGSWQDKTTHGNILWLVKQSTDCCALWNQLIEGTSSDSYGNGSVKGSCTLQACVIEQVYTSGTLKGKKYIYSGIPVVTKDTQILKSVSGSWKQGNASGTFAVATTCSE